MDMSAVWCFWTRSLTNLTVVVSLLPVAFAKELQAKTKMDTAQPSTRLENQGGARTCGRGNCTSESHRIQILHITLIKHICIVCIHLHHLQASCCHDTHSKTAAKAAKVFKSA